MIKSIYHIHYSPLLYINDGSLTYNNSHDHNCWEYIMEISQFHDAKEDLFKNNYLI